MPCFSDVWAKASRIGLLTYTAAQSSECGKGVQASFEKYGEQAKAKIAFSDLSLTYGTGDMSVQVSKMKDAKVDLSKTFDGSFIAKAK